MKLPNGDEIEVIREAEKTRIRIRERPGKASVMLTTEQLEEHITACAMERFRADPVGYERFIVMLLPHVVREPAVVTYRETDVDGREQLSVRVDSDGRTTITEIDGIEIDDNSGTKR